METSNRERRNERQGEDLTNREDDMSKGKKTEGNEKQYREEEKKWVALVCGYKYNQDMETSIREREIRETGERS